MHKQNHPDQAPELHRRASEWYTPENQINRPIHHALAAGDFERAADLIGRATESVWMRSEINTFLGWVEALPEETVRARPRLGVFHAGASLISGQPLEAIQTRLQEVEEADRDDVTGELAAFRTLIAAFQGEMERAEALYRQTLEWAGDDAGDPLPVASKALIGLGEILRAQKRPRRRSSSPEARHRAGPTIR